MEKFFFVWYNKYNGDKMKKLIKKILENKIVVEFIKFGLVGVVNTLLGLAIYYLLIHFNVHYIIANLISFVLSVLNSFFLNNKYVFKDNKKDKILKKLFKVYLSYGFTLLLGTLLLYLQVDILGISELVAPVINLVVTIPLNFLLNRNWAFKN